MSYTRTWSEVIPAAHTAFKDTPTGIQNVRTDVAERLKNILSGFSATEIHEGIKKAKFLTVGTGAPTAPSGTGGTATDIDMYARMSGTGTYADLYIRNTTGNEIKLTNLDRLNSAAILSAFRSGDMLFSSNTATPADFTDVSGTYSDKFIRISTGTALDTGGADTHSHTLGETNLAAHTHTITEEVHRGSGHGTGFGWSDDDYTGPAEAKTSASTGSGTAFTGDNVPAYIQIKAYQRN